MSDLRTCTALRQLADLGHRPDPPVWDWGVARLEPSGRLLLPAGARTALGAARRRGEVVGLCHRAALVLRAAGTGRPMTIDGRGRLYVPVSLRQDRVPWLLVGTHHQSSTVVVAPTSVLDGVGDTLLGEAR